MSNLSDFLPVGGGSALSVVQQQGVLISSSGSNGSGQDTKYYDIPISAVSNIDNCFTEFVGGFGTGAAPSTAGAAYGVSASMALTRLTSTTNLRIHTGQPGSVSSIYGVWIVKELV